jgi:aryl-alcohol dehydrogenase-like predicted oxidoreductase
LFDTAEFYDYGQSEVQLGVSLKSLGVQRKDYVVITKLLKGGFGPNDMGLSRKHIIEGMKNSLKRLNMDYVMLTLSSLQDRILLRLLKRLYALLVGWLTTALHCTGVLLNGTRK